MYKIAVALLFISYFAVNANRVPVVPALVRAPEYDSAVIQSDRIGGNFAYSTVEAHAYKAVVPVIKTVPAPVAVEINAQPIVAPVVVAPPAPQVYYVPAPAPRVYYAPAPVYPYIYAAPPAPAHSA